MSELEILIENVKEDLVKEALKEDSLLDELRKEYPHFKFSYSPHTNIAKGSIEMPVITTRDTINYFRCALHQAIPEYKKIEKDYWDLIEKKGLEIQELEDAHKAEVAKLKLQIKTLKEMLHDELIKAST